MAERMVSKTVWVHNDRYAEICKQAEDLGIGVGEYLRVLLERYVAGELDVQEKQPLSRKQTSFYVPPGLLSMVEDRSKAQGYTFGTLMNLLMDRALVQNKNQLD